MDHDQHFDLPIGEEPARLRPAWQRAVLLGSGVLCLVLGILGLFLPFLPGVVFLILAAACFTRSSPRFEAWLIDHPVLGPPVQTWRATGAIPRRAKWIAWVSLAASWLLIYASDAPALAKLLTIAIFVAVGCYIATRPDAPPAA